MRRVLFFNDDPKVLNSYRDAMKKHPGRVDAVFAADAETAMQLVTNASPDVFVSEIKAPGSTSALLLGTIKEDHPELVRMTLCHPSEMNSIFAAWPMSHQVLAKPLDAEELSNVIERTFGLRALLTDSLRKRVGALDELPSVPAVYRELMNAMADPEVSIQEIARIVERDSAMAAKTLQLANSACFGASIPVTTLNQAVAYLGMELIKNLSLTVHIFAACERTARRSGFSFEVEQEHSTMTARMARRLLSNPRQSLNAFTAGLLHDIGRLVLAVCTPEKFKKIMHVCNTAGRPSHEVESEILGVTHAEVGAYLLGLWGLPYAIVEAVAYHHNPGAALEVAFDVPSAVSLANSLVEEATRNTPIAITNHLESMNVIGRLPEWRAMAKEELQPAAPQRKVS